MLSQKQITGFQNEILDWYEKNKRDLPWRRPSLKLRNGKTRDPYAILVSEIMLQQTQVSRVIPKFHAWMKKFPTIEKLAKATTRDVLLYWSGLGYNRRALYLKKLAKEVVKNNNGAFSQNEKELMMLPGIGEYTARALLCFAFNKQVAVVDTNIRKVIAVTFFKGKVPEKKTVEEIAGKLLPKDRAYEWNQALMDYSALVVSKDKNSIHLLRQGFEGQAKQSQFKTSSRFYRGQALRVLLLGPETIDSIFEKLENNGITKKAFKIIIHKMEKEGIILIKEGKIEFS